LKYKDFKNGYDQKTEVTTFDLRRGKTGEDFVTFLNPEASKAVWDYLAFRGRTVKVATSKRVQQLEKQRITEDGYLFIVRNVPDIFLKTHDEGLRKLRDNNITKINRSLSEKAVKNTPSGTWNIIRSHNMRKYFNSTLINNGCNPYQTDLWMGHDLGESKGAYMVPIPAKQREIYMQFMHLLTVEKQFDPADSIEFKQMQRENERLERITAKTAVERDELQELRAEMEKMKKIDSGLESLIEAKMAEMVEARVNEILKNTKG
jgi:hypothetical protein